MSKIKVPERDVLASSTACSDYIMPKLLFALANNVVKKGGQPLTTEQRNSVAAEVICIAEKKWYDSFKVAKCLEKFPWLKVDEDTIYAISQLSTWVKEYCDGEILKVLKEIRKEYSVGDIVGVPSSGGCVDYAIIKSFEGEYTVSVTLVSSGTQSYVLLESLLGKIDGKDPADVRAALRHLCIIAGVRLGLLKADNTTRQSVFELRKLLRLEDTSDVDMVPEPEDKPVVQYRDYLPGQEVYSSKFVAADGSYEKLTVLSRTKDGYETRKDTALSHCRVYDNNLLIPLPDESQQVCFYDNSACTTVCSGIVNRVFKELRKADVIVLKHHATGAQGAIASPYAITINLIDIIPSLTGLTTFIGRNE